MGRKGFIAAALALVLSVGSFGHVGTMQAEAAENLIVNGNFDDADNLEIWNGGGHRGDAVITAEVSDTPIGDDQIMTYGKITGRTSNWQAFAYDVTDLVESGEIYEFSFYVMLDAEEYKDAPASQRTVELSTHIVTGTSELYSNGANGKINQVLEPGVWTKFSGTFSYTWSGDLELLALRFLEQGENYGSGPGIKGTYYLTGVKFNVQEKETKLIEKDIVDLRTAVNNTLGTEEFVVGASIEHKQVNDIETMGLVTKHFNAITLGNELKPDFLLDKWAPKFVTTVVNGEEMTVPQLNFNNAEKALNYILRWNKNNPTKQIKVRGHVLVWHSQTPDWFFHEDYDTTKPMVSTDVMNARLEWYIASVAEHFTGADSKYKDLFYAWDVVNEAVSDGTGTYRNDKENSKWWALYQSNEFIIQAFRFANKYMPESVALYYNDYNESDGIKREGIAQLLRDVKAAEGTRIDGMGMQGHNQPTISPTVEEFEKAARLYASIVDEVQITEWDVKITRGASISDDYGKIIEYIRQAEYYHSFYEAIQRMRADGVNFTGMTFWGTIDTTSWLQDVNTVGGASDGKMKHYPLLFDGNYKAKPSFWAFADEEKYQAAIAAKPTPSPIPEPTKAPESTEVSADGTAADATENPLPTNVPTGTIGSEGGPDAKDIALIAGVVIVAAAVVVTMRKKKKGD